MARNLCRAALANEKVAIFVKHGHLEDPLLVLWCFALDLALALTGAANNFQKLGKVIKFDSLPSRALHQLIKLLKQHIITVLVVKAVRQEAHRRKNRANKIECHWLRGVPLFLLASDVVNHCVELLHQLLAHLVGTLSILGLLFLALKLQSLILANLFSPGFPLGLLNLVQIV